MENLVIIKDNKAVTDSLMVAEVFGKRHADVMRDIRSLECSELFRERNFAQSVYLNSQNKEMPMYHMNRLGFSFLVMGYTGTKAAEFKEKYINQFEEMEESLRYQPRVLSEREQLMASMKLSLETAEEIATVKEDVIQLKDQMNNQMTIDHGQQIAILATKNKRVEKLWSERQINTEFFDTKRKVHAQAWRDLKLAFGVASYRDIKKKDYEEALAFVKAWRPRMF